MGTKSGATDMTVPEYVVQKLLKLAQRRYLETFRETGWRSLKMLQTEHYEQFSDRTRDTKGETQQVSSENKDSFGSQPTIYVSYACSIKFVYILTMSVWVTKN